MTDFKKIAADGFEINAKALENNPDDAAARSYMLGIMMAKHLNEEHQCLLLLSPMGGQGFLIGRGNLQLSPEVLRKIGLDNILGVATSAKLLSLNSLRIDTGDRTLDEEFIERKYLKLLQGYRTTRIMRVAED